MIDQLFMNQLANDMREPEEEPVQDVLLAAGPVASDMDKPFIGTRLNVPRAGQPQPTKEERQKLAINLADSLAGMPKGAIEGYAGLAGDLESIGRMALNYFGYDVSQETVLPTIEEVRKKLESVLGPVVPKGQTTISPTEEREQAASIGEFIGELTAPSAYITHGKALVKGAGKAIQATKNMPVGMSTEMVGEGVSDLGFYSAAKQAVDSIQQPKGTGEQFLKQIEKTPGVKPEEIKWTGLDDFLKSKKTVTKAEVQEYLDKNRVEIKEVRLGEQETYNPARLQQLEDEWSKLKQHPIDDPSFGESKYDEMIRLMNIRDRSTTESLYQLYDDAIADAQSAQRMGRKNLADKFFKEAELYNTRAEKLDLEGLGMDAPTKFSKYTLPGGENYREILLTLPSKNPEFKSQHFDQPNVLAHMRVNDRVDADGKKVLFVEEVQSDWHQAGRKKGYASAEKPYEVFDPKDGNVIATFKTEKEAKAYADELGPNVDYAKSEGVPDAPFKTTWHELSLKRAIQVAAEGGYDRIAFTTGKTQAERYDLSKQIGQINARPTPDGKISLEALTPDMGEQVIQRVVMADELDDIVGKEIAEKIRNQIEYPKNFDDRGKSVELSGLDLKVGGEGMKGFYDQILPKFLDKYAKKWDAKVGTTQIRLASDKQDMADSALLGELGLPKGGKAMADVQYIDITPKMKESVLTKGQPLFAIGAGGAAVQQEENE
jgi:hypothetical protein